MIDSRFRLCAESAAVIKGASHAPWRGAGSLAGGEQSEPPEYCDKRMRPGRGAGRSCNPCRGAYRCSSSTPGARFAHPRLISLRPAGAEYVILFMKRDSHYTRLRERVCGKPRASDIFGAWGPQPTRM